LNHTGPVEVVTSVPTVQVSEDAVIGTVGDEHELKVPDNEDSVVPDVPAYKLNTAV